MTAKAAPGATGLSIVPSERGVDVMFDGQLFAGYATAPGHQPSVWPILGPSGMEMTRSLPLGPARPEERDDHPHHRSLWFAHGDVNGHDFWHHRTGRDVNPEIVHRSFDRQETLESGAVVLQSRNDWMVGEERVLSDVRTIVFAIAEQSGAGSPRTIDFTIRLIASDGPVTLGDTKEGTFAVRVPGPMKLDADLGGGIVNDRGQTDGQAWGQPAHWVDYHGPLDVPRGDESPPEGGVVLMSHPESFRPECRWHVRGYGLFAANPFGAADFPPGEPAQGATTIAAGDHLTLRYRCVFYADTASAEQIDDWYAAFAETPLEENTSP